MKLLKSLINKIRNWRTQRAEDQKMLEKLEDLTGDYFDYYCDLIDGPHFVKKCAGKRGGRISKRK